MNHKVHLHDIFEFEYPENEVHIQYGLKKHSNIMKTTSIDIIIPDKYDSKDVNDILMSSGFSPSTANEVTDSYNRRKTASVDMIIPDKYDSKDVNDILMSSGFSPSIANKVADLYDRQKTASVNMTIPDKYDSKDVNDIDSYNKHIFSSIFNHEDVLKNLQEKPHVENLNSNKIKLLSRIKFWFKRYKDKLFLKISEEHGLGGAKT